MLSFIAFFIIIKHHIGKALFIEMEYNRGIAHLVDSTTVNRKVLGSNPNGSVIMYLSALKKTLLIVIKMSEEKVI